MGEKKEKKKNPPASVVYREGLNFFSFSLVLFFLLLKLDLFKRIEENEPPKGWL